LIQLRTAEKSALLDDVLLETLNKLHHFALLSFWHLELRQGRRCMTKKHVPAALADAHASVSESHVPAAVVRWSTRTSAEVVDQELLLALDAVFTTMRPETTELRIIPKPRELVIRHSTDRIVTTKTLIKSFRAHHALLVDFPER
jgi:hypothetical protein